VFGDQAQFAHLRFEWGGAHDGNHFSGQSHHLAHPRARLCGGEVTAHTRAQRATRSDVEDSTGVILEEIDAGRIGESVSEGGFASDSLGHLPRVAQKVVKGVDVQRPEAFEESVQHVDRGLGIVERAVRGLHGRSEEEGQSREFRIAHFSAGQHGPSQPNGVDDRGLGPGQSVGGAGPYEEADVEGGVVSHQHRAAHELQERGQDGLDARRVGDHRVRDARQHGDHRRDRSRRSYESGEFAEYLTAAHFDSADFGDRVVG